MYLCLCTHRFFAKRKSQKSRKLRKRNWMILKAKSYLLILQTSLPLFISLSLSNSQQGQQWHQSTTASNAETTSTSKPTTSTHRTSTSRPATKAPSPSQSSTPPNSTSRKRTRSCPSSKPSITGGSSGRGSRSSAAAAAASWVTSTTMALR